MDRHFASLLVHVHPDDPSRFTWVALIFRRHARQKSPFVARIQAMPRYRYKSRRQAEFSAKKTVTRLMPNIEWKK